ncbi:radical SAM protein [Candidatus Woesearchaeota archaeon]|nr:radical SAM protein [Candidatus Woesearchaeota archaeon]
MYTILDCYTDEAAGLGVPPYLGTYPRYIAGSLKGNVNYITIDDLRLWKKYNGKVKIPSLKEKTQISTYNLTKNDVSKVLDKTTELIVVLGVHVPGKYLSAIPGTLNEVSKLLEDVKCKKILTGPAVFGTQLFGGKLFEKLDKNIFDEVNVSLFRFSYKDVSKYAILGAKKIYPQIPDIRMIEIETGRGCDIGHCSFCTEPLKNKVEFRDRKEIIKEMEIFYSLGARYFRFGKQTCFYTYPDAIKLLEEVNKKFKLKVLHIDNVNPVKVIMDKDDSITKAIVKYCTSGNIAAFGIESFDPNVVKANTLNTSPVVAMKAIRIINKYGSKRGSDGLPKFLPGVNIIFGLIDESKNTHKENMKYLTKILDENLLLRRINIRQAAIFENTKLYNEAGNKFLRKNKKYYWKWRNEIRQKIDNEMLKRVIPSGTILKDCYAEIYDGNTTFLRQFGTYPLIIGVKGRLELKKFFDVKVTGHMLRSLTGEIE